MTPVAPPAEPDVSIILSVWNDARWIDAFIAAVLAQSHGNFELIVTDDASDDNSHDLLLRYRDPRIVVYRNDKRRHWLNAINDMCGIAKGRLIKMMCADDLMRPDCLAHHVALHAAHPDLGYSFSSYELIDSDGRRVGDTIEFSAPDISSPTDAYAYFMTQGCCVGTSTICVPRARWMAVGGLRDVTTTNRAKVPVAEDFDLAARLSAAWAAGYIRKPLVGIRTHADRLSETPDIRGLNVEAKLSILAHVAATLDQANAVPFHAVERLNQMGAGHINIGLHYILTGRVSAGFGIIAAVLRVLPPLPVFRSWLHHLSRRLRGNQRTERIA